MTKNEEKQARDKQGQARDEATLWDRVRFRLRRIRKSMPSVDPANLVMNRPRADVYEKEGLIVYETELPGISKEDVSVRIENGKLTVAGEAKQDETLRRDNYYRRERSYGRVERSFAIPADRVDPTESEAQFEDGVVRVSIPLKESFLEARKPIDVEIS